ncbi:hypothetical protein CYY_006717 [Polysphondylium violaceum]|uniref:Protein MON2 homolog n=1 Tax=Polysphondylium violaceum TaxID=133409 RepID=A0A8J4PRT8_9MYCE|nr:hypothetical protein CYY_006717 [Polysphondylium violaceum]
MDKIKPLLTVLQSDLRGISQEARSKFLPIKEASERGILKLKYLEEQKESTEKLIEALSNSEDVFKPFFLACDTKNQKMISIAIGSLLKLISHSAVSLKTLPFILQKMQMLIDVGSEESVQLKVLQGLLVLITTMNEIHDDNLSQCLVLCFRLHGSKNTSIQSTSSATLPQIIRIIFDRVNNELSNSTAAAAPVITTTTTTTTTISNTSDSPVTITTTSSTTTTPAAAVEDEKAGDNTATPAVVVSGEEQQSESTPSTDQQPTATTTTTTAQQSNSDSSTNTPAVTTPATAQTPTTSTPPQSPALVSVTSHNSHNNNHNGLAPSSLKPYAKDAYLLLQDLCLITGGDSPIWLPQNTTISRSAGLEFIEMVISVHSNIFLNMEEFINLLKDRICPLMMKSFKFKMDFHHTVRLIRLITQFISKYSAVMVTESDVLLTRCIKMMDNENPLWMQILALESFRIYTEDPNLLRLFYTNYDKDNNSAKIFENMTCAIGKYVQNLYNLDSSHFVLVNTSKNRCFDLLWQTESPSVKENYIISLCTESINGIVNAVSKINNPDIQCDKDIFPQMANSCWVSILGAISMLLSKTLDEALIQMVLKALQSFTNTCGDLHLSAPRDALLTCLCKITILPSFDQNSFLNLSNSGSGKDKDSGKDNNSNSGKDSKDKDSNKDANNIDSPSVIDQDKSTLQNEKEKQANLNNFYPTVKNILSVKILFNIAHCMGEVLDESWILVLETLETWNRFLETFARKKDQNNAIVGSGGKDSSGGNGGNNNGDMTSSPKEMSSPRNYSEIPILVNSMDNLFKSSSQLDLKSITFLLEALGKLCISSFNLKSFNSTPNMFGISKLKETALANLYRIDKIWPLISDHIIDAGNHRNPQFRKYSVDFLNVIIRSTIALQNQYNNLLTTSSASNSNQTSPILNSNTLEQVNQESINDSEVTTTTTTIATEQIDDDLQSTTSSTLYDDDDKNKEIIHLDKNQIQLEFFRTLEELSFSTSSDTREKVLESVHQILSSSGQSLTSAWPTILSLLLRVSQSSEKRFISLAFETLELICNEFLSNLSTECLGLTIEVVESFASQKSDINISLTASSGLFSDLTYFLANENSIQTSKYHLNDGTAVDPVQEAVAKTTTKVLNPRNRPSISPASPYFTEKKRSLIDRMWLCSFSSMKNLCIDSRPAIRNGVVVSLFQILTTYIHLFKKDLLDLILWTMLFPLIEEIKSCSEKADQERIDSDLGGGVMMLVHHSRNTAQKQWDETIVLSIGGMVRIFRSFFETLFELDSFNKAWQTLLATLESESKSSSKEVSMTSLSSLHELVNTSTIVDPSHQELSESIWECLLRLSPKLSDSRNSPSPKSLAVYIKVFTDLFQKTRPLLNHDQMNRALVIIYPLGLYIGDSSTDLSNPQTHAVQILKTLPPISQDIFASVIAILLKYIAIGINFHQQYTPVSAVDLVFPQITITKDLVYYSTITEKSLDLVTELFLHPSTTDTMRSSIYHDIIKVFGAAMLTKYSKFHSNIWKISVTSLIKILPSGLLSINQDSVYLNDIKRNIIWSELIDTIQTFVIVQERPNVPMSPEKKLEEDKYDIDLINAISKEMFGFSGIKVERVSIIRDRLVEILYEGSILSSQGREKVSQSCYQNMFSICAKAHTDNPESIEIAKVVLPVVMKRCKEVLHRFYIDERQSGHYPLPRHRLNEVSFILKEILQLQLQPGVYQLPQQFNDAVSTSSSNRPHLLELYTILCDCICTSEKEIKELLRNIFLIVAKEFLYINK